jgi:iron complex transport system substrate-binding protein
MRTIRSLAITLIITALIVGCGTPATPEPTATSAPGEPATEVPTEIDPTQPPEPEPITVVDALGNETTFEQPPERIAIAGRATALIAHSMYMFPEALDRVVAVEDRVQRNLSFYRIVDPAFDQKFLLERNAGPEQIIPSNPDVVLMKSYLAESLGEPIEQLGIPVIYLDLETPEQFERDITMIGELLGNPTRAEEILEFYNTRVDQVAAIVDPIPEDQYPSVLMMQYSDRGGEIAFNVPSTEWLQTSLIELGGGSPVWFEAAQGAGWTIVGFEQIAAWDPQVVMVIYYPDSPAPIVESLEADETWQALSATQDGQIYAFPGDFLSWDQPDPRWILGLQWVTKTLHPEASSSIDMRAEIIAFYKDMYGLDEQTIESEVLIHLVTVVE